MKTRTIRRLSGPLLVTLALQACGDGRATVTQAPGKPVTTDLAPAQKPPDDTLLKLTPQQTKHEIDLKNSDAGAPVNGPPEFPTQGIYATDVDAPVPSGMFLPTSKAVVLLADRVVQVWAGFDGRNNPDQGSVYVVVHDRKSGGELSSSLIDAPVGVGPLIAASIDGTTLTLRAPDGQLLNFDVAVAIPSLR